MKGYISTTFILSLIIAGCSTGPREDKDIFNGKDLKGWSAANMQYWSVEDSAIVGHLSDTLARNQFLWSNIRVKDFYLSIDIKHDSSDRNAGIQFRSSKADESGQAIGYQADVGINLGNNVWGTLYHEDGRGLLNGSDAGSKTYREGQWNHYEILAVGNKIWTAINGAVATATNDEGGELSGYIALQIHAGPPQTVRYRVNKLIHNPEIKLAGLDEEQLNKLLRVPMEPAKGHDLLNFNKGDTVVFTGGTNVSVMQEDGYLETLLTAHLPAHKLHFRNMAWDGDNVFEQFRDEGFGSWNHNIDSIGANVVFVQFGQMESLDSSHSITEFTDAYKKIITGIKKDGRRIVVLSPTPFEPSKLDINGRKIKRNPLSNKTLEKYTYEIQKLAQEEGCVYVDLFYLLQIDTSISKTYDGIHLNDTAQKLVASGIMKRFKYDKKYSPSLDPLKNAILRKNKIWFDYWRPGNWAFLHGNRTESAFSRDWRDSRKRIFPEEMKLFAPLLEAAEKQVYEIANGNSVSSDNISQNSDSSFSSVSPAEYSVEAELASFQLDKRYNIELFASEQLGIAEPCTMRWDERGRLWVLCIPAYPQRKPGQIADDKLVILEDTDKDGRADKSVVFADHLDIPLGFELGHGGVYVGEQTKMLFLKDTNNDSKADLRTIVLSGFGTHDSHQTLNSFTWSPGGELFLAQGLSIHSRIETPWGVKKADRGGIWRYSPLTHELDNIVDESTASDNPWGMNFGDWGEMFAKSNDTGIYFMNPALALSPYKTLIPEIGATVIKSGIIEMPRSKHLPDEMRNQLLVAGYYNNKIERFKFETEGSGYKAKLIEPLLSSNSKNFRPVDIKVGPDGAIYILDWFNPIIGHYQASLRDPMRDKTHGRVWRITAKGRPLVNQPDLKNQSALTLLGFLNSDEYWLRYQVRRLLAAKPVEEVQAALDKWVAGLDKKRSDYEHNLMEALAVYETHELVNEPLLKKLLSAKNPGARGYTLQVAGRWHDRISDPVSLIKPFLNDNNSRVRLQALVALSRINQPGIPGIVSDVLNHPMDKFLNHAFVKTVFPYKDNEMPARVRYKLDDLLGGAKHDISSLQQFVKSESLPGSAKAVNSAVPDEYDAAYEKKLMNAVKENGNAKRGAIIYNTKLNCSACHKLNGKGGNIGPNLSAIGSGLSVSDIITEVLWPNKNIKEGYSSVILNLKNGKSIQGIKVMETADGISIKSSASSAPVLINKNNITGAKNIGSAMPKGLTSTLTETERADLIRFLTELRN